MPAVADTPQVGQANAPSQAKPPPQPAPDRQRTVGSEPPPLAVVCLSGGMDSCVTLAEAALTHEPCALHFSYGQRTQARELEAFRAVCDHYGVARRLVANQPALREVGGSALTDASIVVPTQIAGARNVGDDGGDDGGGHDGDDDGDHDGDDDGGGSGGGEREGLGPGPARAEAIPVTYVPFRNAQILSLAVAWAEALGAVAVYMGAVEEDSSGYPDCREQFFRAFAAAIEAGTRPQTHIALVTPLLHLSKAQIVRRGVALGAPFHLTWSCYTEQDRACGACESCRLRLRGFEAAGVADPISYAL
jgi:7-cyano-7-deazaguanine synthase